MKVFIVNFKNNFNLQPYEPFYYEGMKNGDVAVYGNTLQSFDELMEVRKWLTAEINRNPFQLEEGVVALLIPRDLTVQPGVNDYDIFVRIYIHEILKKHFDGRFRYICFFIDRCDNLLHNTAVYHTLDAPHRTFSSEDPVLNTTLFPDKHIIQERTLANFDTAIDKLSDCTVRAFYRETIDSLHIREESNDNIAAVLENFAGRCLEKLSDIAYYNVPYAALDVSQNITVNFKLTDVIYKIAQDNSPLPSFSDERAMDNSGFFPNYSIDLERIKTLLITYKRRLSSRLSRFVPAENAGEAKPVEAVFNEDFKSLKEYKELTQFVDSISVSLNISIGDLDENNASDLIFENVKQQVSDADRTLARFAAAVVEKVQQWRRAHRDFRTERAETDCLTENEKSAECEATEKLNQYVLLEQIGFSEENRIIQILEGQDVKLQRIAAKLKTYTRAAFIGSLVFALLVIAVLYFGVQVTVFVKEHTWWVYGAYLAVTALSFLPAYGIIKHRYIKEFRDNLKICTDLINDYFRNYVKRADEFAANMTAATEYLCLFSHLNAVSLKREERLLQDAQYAWHRAKIASLLKDISYFDAFTINAKPVDEKNVPDIDVSHDAVHNDFYQLKLFI